MALPHYDGFSVSGTPAFNGGGHLAKRICAAYSKAITTPLGSTASMWLTGPMFELKRSLHETLIGGNQDDVAELLADPGRSDLLYGFEDNAISLHVANDDARQQTLLAGQRDQLLLLGEALGVAKLRKSGSVFQESVRIEELLLRLDDILKIRIDFPNPYPREAGLTTSRGILTYRATQALYQAFKIRQLTSHKHNPSIVEIGAGSGRTAYYAWRLGLTNYTIVDLPLTCVASANFLGRTLGAESVSLFGEEDKAGIKIIPPEQFFESQDRFDLAINVDSITEMAKSTAEAYFAEISKRADVFLSINHEGNEFQARDLFGTSHASRHPFWMRNEYVEEVVQLQSTLV